LNEINPVAWKAATKYVIEAFNSRGAFQISLGDGPNGHMQISQLIQPYANSFPLNKAVFYLSSETTICSSYDRSSIIAGDVKLGVYLIVGECNTTFYLD
jgi:hypothetical protein